MEKQNQQVICNCCGKQITLEPKTEREDYLFVEKDWRDNFAVPVEIRMQTELL